MSIQSRFFLLLFFLILLPFALNLAAQTSENLQQELFSPVEELLRQAEEQQAPLLAPGNYARGVENYQRALDLYRKNGKLKEIRSFLAQAEAFLNSSIRSADISRTALAEVLENREYLLTRELDKLAPRDFSKAEDELRTAAEEIEAGKLNNTQKRSDKIKSLYRDTVINAYREVVIKQALGSLETRKATLPGNEFKDSRNVLDDIDTWLKDQKRSGIVVQELVSAVDERLGLVVEILYPPWYRNLPDTLELGEFELVVESYQDKGHYNLATDQAEGVSGLARVRFNCGYQFFLPPLLGQMNMIYQPFTVVETVLDPVTQISLAEARYFNASINKGEEISLPLELTSTEKFAISHAKADLLQKIKPLTAKSGILVQFREARIAPAATLTRGYLLAGEAAYPTLPVSPELPALLHVAGFTLAIDSLYLDVTGAQITAQLRLPPSLLEAEGCEPASIDLGTVSITHDCQFYREFPDSSYGEWIIDKTGMVVHGTGIKADFRKDYSPAGYGLANDWRGLILGSGSTVPEPSGSVTSNSGYLRAPYSYSRAFVTASGFASHLDLSAGYQFTTLVPLGYQIAMSSGYILIDSSAVQSGAINTGQIVTPTIAACRDNPGSKISAYFTDLAIQKDLDLSGSVNLSQRISWGELTTSGAEKIYFNALPDAGEPDHAWFYLNGTASHRYLPVDTSDFETIHFWGDISAQLEEKNLAGITLLKLADLIIFTPDIPGSDKKLEFSDGADCSLSRSWLNIETLGVSGEINISFSSRQEELGDPATTYYRAEQAFDTDLGCIRQKERCFFLRFASSAMFDSEIHGLLQLKGACNAGIPFVDLELTSTAHLVGGDIDLSAGPVTLDYWQVELVETSPGDPAGALSVRTGQIILTQAGIQETRHFAKPFKLIWGEMLADGNIGELFFDYNSADQKFDGFLFTPHQVALSAYDAAVPGYLQVCGDNHFNFFGSSYLSIQDSVFTGDDPLGVFAGRRIGIMTKESESCSASDLQLTKNWGGGTSSFDFNIVYDDNDQDGFLGEGEVWLPEHLQQEATASVQIDRNDIAIGLLGSAGNNAILLGVDIGSAAEMWGCINIEGNSLECIMLGYTLESTAQSAFGILGGAGGMIEAKTVIKPTVTTFAAAGMMYLDLSLGGNVSINGSILLTADRSAASIYGDLQGELDFSSICAGLEANGHVNWYLSPVTQYLQGRAGISVYGRSLGSAGLTGGIFIGNNVPRSEVWVLTDGSNRYAVNISAFPEYITGVYGFGQVSLSLDFGIFAGGIEIYAGMGAFVNMGGSSLVSELPALPLPYILANFGVSLHGEILWGLVSASAWVNLQLMVGDPFYFQGTAGLEGCVLWVVCASADVTVTLDEDGFDID